MRISDWSSDVCSSDLAFAAARDRPPARRPAAAARHDRHNAPPPRRRRRLFVACGGRSWLVALAEPHLLFQPFKGQRRPMTAPSARSEEHTSELQSLMRISYAVFCLKKKTKTPDTTQ